MVYDFLNWLYIVIQNARNQKIAIIVVVVAALLYLFRRPLKALVIRFILRFSPRETAKKTFEGILIATINKHNNEFNKEVGMAIISTMNTTIKWKTNETKEEFLEQNCVVLYLRGTDGEDTRYIDAIKQYICSSAFLGLIKNNLKNETIRVIECATIHAYAKGLPILVSTGCIAKALESILITDAIKQQYDKLCSLQERKLYTYMFLRELVRADRFHRQVAILNEFDSETNRFIDFIYGIALKDEEQVPLDFPGVYFNVSAVILGKKARLIESDLKPYITRVEKLLQENRIVYVFASNTQKENLRNLENSVKTNQLLYSLFFEHIYYHGMKKGNGMCLIIEKPKTQQPSGTVSWKLSDMANN